MSDALASNLDLLPTFAAMAGLAPRQVELDGRDLSGVIFNGAPSPNDQFVFFDNVRVAAIRTARWKYVVRAYYRTHDVPLDAFGYPLLFDLDLDPGETYSVASLHPDIVRDMQARLEAARARYEPMAEAFPPHVPPPGARNHPD